MSGAGNIIASGFVPPIPDTTLWSWVSGVGSPGYTVSGFPGPNGVSATKTGLLGPDLQSFVGIPLQYYGKPPVPVSISQLTDWIRWAEDRVEQETSLLLCQTWIASPPGLWTQAAQSIGVNVNGATGGQVRGLDYDLEDNAYDFMFPRAQDEGWMYLTLRYRPVQSVTYGVSGNAATAGYTGVKNIAYVYPLLNQFFRVPPNWIVEDKDYGMIRLVPAANVQMLPLFAMQLAFMGFAESVPGAIWVQYTAGLTPYDYQNRYSFIKELVLAEAAVTALAAIQATINLGIESSQVVVDGLQYRQDFNKEGALAPYIKQFEKRRDYLMKRVANFVSGPMVNSI